MCVYIIATLHQVTSLSNNNMEIQNSIHLTKGPKSHLPQFHQIFTSKLESFLFDRPANQQVHSTLESQ